MALNSYSREILEENKQPFSFKVFIHVYLNKKGGGGERCT